MGRGMLQDAQTLEACKIPAFDTHPTPVNVSVLRRSSTTNSVSTRTASGARPSHQTTGGPMNASTSSSSSSTPGCMCVLQ
ncbi:hypothetical protein PINS_up002701 [Pythium insidiosum]|nr:hypothetical protein PINS_up002701 [Pythium insidiosum]